MNVQLLEKLLALADDRSNHHVSAIAKAKADKMIEEWLNEPLPETRPEALGKRLGRAVRFQWNWLMEK